MTESQTQTRSYEKVTRPPAVWLTQTFFVFVWLFLLFMLARSIWQAFNFTSNFVGAAIVLSALGLLVVSFAVAFWGLAKKQNWGRWLAVFLLLLMWGFVFYSDFNPPTGPSIFFTYDKESPQDEISVVPHLFLGLLVFRMSFAKKVNRFFQS